MNDEEYEDYLVDKARELLKEQTSDAETEVPENSKDKHLTDEMKDKEDSKIPFAWDPREVEHLARNRKSMSNKDFEDFMESDSKFHEEAKKVDDWKGFSRWEERHIITNHGQQTVEEIAGELDRDPKEVKLKMRMMGFIPEE